MEKTTATTTETAKTVATVPTVTNEGTVGRTETTTASETTETVVSGTVTTVATAKTTRKLVVGFDSEYVNSTVEKDKVDTISYQLYITEEDIADLQLFIDVYQKERMTIEEIVQKIEEAAEISEDDKAEIVLVAHYSIAEAQNILNFRKFTDELRTKMETEKENNKDKEEKERDFFKNIRDSILFRTKISKSTVTFTDTHLLLPMSLKNIGDALRLKKLDDYGYRETDMSEFYKKDPENFKKYGIRDAEITAKTYKLIEEELKSDMALTAAGVLDKKITEILKRKRNFAKFGYTACKSKAGRIFNLKLNKKLEIFKEVYYGGRNEAFVWGSVDEEVYDYDLISAYSRIISTMPVWNINPKNIAKQKITNENFVDIMKKMKEHSNMTFAVGFVNCSFEFKNNVLPSFPQKSDTSLVFPRSGVDVFVTITEVFEAFVNNRLEKIIVNFGTVYFPAYDKKRKTINNKEKDIFVEKENIISKILSEFIDKRTKYKKEGNKFFDNLYKIIINSAYGKFAQGISPKKVVNLSNSTQNKVSSELLKESKITNAMIASYITAVIRALCSEMMNYIQQKGGKIFSMTTDGFVTNYKFSDDELKYVGLFTKKYYERVKDNLLELKHSGQGLTTIKTRCYFMHNKLQNAEKSELLVSASGLQLKGTNEERIKEISTIFSDLKNIKDKKRQYKQKQQSIYKFRQWYINKKEGNYFSYKGFNFDYDFKRELVMTNKDDFFETKAWESLTDYEEARQIYYNFDKAKKGTSNKLYNKTEYQEFLKYYKLNKNDILEKLDLTRLTESSKLAIFAVILAQSTDFQTKTGKTKNNNITKKLNIPLRTCERYLSEIKMFRVLDFLDLTKKNYKLHEIVEILKDKTAVDKINNIELKVFAKILKKYLSTNNKNNKNSKKLLK